MQYTLPSGEEIKLKPLSDSEYEQAQRLSPKSLAVCPTCGGRDEMISGAGMRRWVSRGYKYRGAEHECNCQAQIALYARYILANIGEQYMRLNWDDYGGLPEADQWVKDYLAEWPSYQAHGFGLVFSSRRQGVGKTWAATHIGKQLIKRRQKVYFLDFVQMVNAFCHDDYEVEQRMRETALLILDDVVTGISERQQDLYALKFEVVIRHRTNFNLPTILTTNLTEAEFEAEFPRIYSLLVPKQKWIAMNGADHRKKEATAIETIEMIARGEMRPIV